MKNVFLLTASLMAGLFVAMAGCETNVTVNESGGDGKSNAVAGSGGEEVHVDWLVSYEEAIAKSKETGKPILAEFTGSDWCGPCMRLHDEVFTKAEFASWAEENVVLLELDFPRKTAQDPGIKEQNAELQVKYEVGGYPTILFLDSSGEVLGSLQGYQPGGPSSMISKASKIISDAS